MLGWMVRPLLAGLAWAVVLTGVVAAQGEDDLARLISEAKRLHGLGQYAAAAPYAERAVALTRQRYGEQHEEFAATLAWLGYIYLAQGRYKEAEPIYRRSLAIAEKALGREHVNVANTLNALAALYKSQGRYGEAEPLYRRSLRIVEKALGADHRSVGTALNNLAELYRAQGYREAVPIYRRSLAIREKALGPNHPEVGTSVSNLALLHVEQGRYSEAEPLYKRGLAIVEKALGRDHPAVAGYLGNLATLYLHQGRYADAERFQRRGLAIREKRLGADHPDIGTSLINLATLYQTQGRYGDAVPLYLRGMMVFEKALGPDHPLVGMSVNSLATLRQTQGRHSEAENLYRRSLAIAEKALGSEHPDVAQSLSNLASLYGDQDRYSEAEPLYQRSLAIREKAFGSSHPLVASSMSNLATLQLAQGNTAEAARYWRRSTQIIRSRAERGLASAIGERATEEAKQLAWQFWSLVAVTHRLASQSGSSLAATAEMFETAQWAHGSEAAVSLAQMALRTATGSPELARLVRERQDLSGERLASNRLLDAIKSRPATKRNADAEREIAERLAAIESRFAQLDRRLAQDFPRYTALTSPAAASVSEVQSQLGDDEALVLILATHKWKSSPDESFVWVVAKRDVRWVRSDLGMAALANEVAALRCGLDAAAWDGEGAEKCATALGIPPAKGAPSPLPFDHARAHKLYAALFDQVQDLIKGKHLLIVPPGPLTQLPFQVLVTKAPADGVRPGGSDPRAQHKGGVMGSAPASAGAQGLTPVDHRAAAWLAREHAITVLPAVSSLKALRRVGRPSAALRPMIGVGNPLLDGPDAGSAEPARLARARQRCPEMLRPWKVTVTALRPGVARVETRGGLADLARLKALMPLPETTDELCAVAHDVKADVARDLRLGSRATEREVKHLSASGELAQYRMVHFATHGALAGELDGTHEPGLVLTPPETASEEDDGYLSASEIATLKLDADWVVLSACNTAAGAASNAEALSGLGRAFIYAGARALLVSHWAVDSDATVKLITGAVREMSRDTRIGRAEAMRRSMLALIDKGTPEEAHPAYWAPFVVVGEGAAGR